MFSNSRQQNQIDYLCSQIHKLQKHTHMLLKERKEEAKRVYLLHYNWKLKKLPTKALYSICDGIPTFCPYLKEMWIPPKTTRGLKKSGYTLEDAYRIQTEILEGETK